MTNASKSSKKYNYLVEQLAIIFGPASTSDVAAFTDAYQNATAAYDHETLKVAIDIIVRNQKVSTWPTIGECLDAVEAAKKQIKIQSSGLVPIENFDVWYRGLLDQIRHADGPGAINAAIAKIRPYAQAKWCFPHRLTEAEALGAKRLAELARGGADR
jgi:hypothetical protein